MVSELDAQFLPSASLRVTDLTLYNQIKADYGLGLGGSGAAAANIIIGASPETLRARYSINYVNNPTPSDYVNLPCVFTTDATSVITEAHVASPTADGIQTLSGVTYTDPNGQLFTSVTWAWQCEVVFYRVADVGAWGQQVVTWIGDGTTGTSTTARLIPTTLDLTQGAVTVWVFPQNTNRPTMHHSGMTGSGYSAAPPSTVGGIMALNATGFRVSDDTPNLVHVNSLGEQYTAIVLQDTTPDNRYMRVGTYEGWPAVGGLHTAHNLANGGHMQGSISAHDLGITVAYSGGVNPPTFGGVVTAVFSSSVYDVAGNPHNETNYTASAPVAARSIVTGGASAFTHIWAFGLANQLVFATDLMPAGQSASLAIAAADLTDMITGLASSFTLGTSLNVQGSDLPYYFVAFNIPVGDPVRALFAPFTVTGNGSVVQATGLGFTPAFAVAREFIAGAGSNQWRGPAHTGTTSTRFDGGSASSGGIQAFGSGTIDIGTSTAPNGHVVHGFALAATGAVTTFPVPTWSEDVTVTNPDGTTSVIQNTVQSQTSPGDGFTLVSDDTTDAPQWWCRAADGYSVFQIDSPGAGYVACVGPTTKNGWYLSADNFGGNPIVVSGGKPADPRSWLNIVGWATGQTGMLGGSPQAAAFLNNVQVYPGTGYTVGTDYPPIRIFNGRSDKELCRLPPTTANAVPQAVLSMLVANGTIYLTTWDTGTTSADWRGRVFQLDPETGVLTSLGTNFAAGEMPYALAWHAGRLWCGTNNGIGTVGKVYFFRPGIDTAWTLDYTTSTSSAGGVDSMVSYKGKLYVGCDNAAASRGKVLTRDTAGAYTTSQTGSGGTAVVNNGYISMAVFGTNLYAAYWNNDTTAISKIEKFDGSSWTTAYTGTGSTLRPFIVLAVDNGITLYAVGGGKLLTAALLSTPDGASWANLTTELPETDTTLLPMFGCVVN